MQTLVAWLVGLLFGLGLMVSGMSNPAKVIGFLDVFGRWDPSLAFVMIGAITVNAIAFNWTKKRQLAYFGGPLGIPKPRQIDRSLVLGSLIFGIGWGLAGFCPAPALTLIMQGGQPLIFVLAMLLGMGIFECTSRNKAR